MYPTSGRLCAPGLPSSDVIDSCAKRRRSPLPGYCLRLPEASAGAQDAQRSLSIPFFIPTIEAAPLCHLPCPCAPHSSISTLCIRRDYDVRNSANLVIRVRLKVEKQRNLARRLRRSNAVYQRLYGHSLRTGRTLGNTIFMHCLCVCRTE